MSLPGLKTQNWCTNLFLKMIKQKNSPSKRNSRAKNLESTFHLLFWVLYLNSQKYRMLCCFLRQSKYWGWDWVAWEPHCLLLINSYEKSKLKKNHQFSSGSHIHTVIRRYTWHRIYSISWLCSITWRCNQRSREQDMSCSSFYRSIDYIFKPGLFFYTGSMNLTDFPSSKINSS